MAFPMFEPGKHPRGYAGRFAGTLGASSIAHALRGAKRPKPAAWKKAHAITPVKRVGIVISRGVTQTVGD